MVAGNALRVDESRGQRWNLALERLGAGDTIIFRDVSLTILPNVFRVLIDTSWKTQREQTPEHARGDIARAEATVAELLGTAPDLSALVGDRTIEYHAIDDYGMGAVWLAKLSEGDFTWTGPPYGESAPQ